MTNHVYAGALVAGVAREGAMGLRPTAASHAEAIGVLTVLALLAAGLS